MGLGMLLAPNLCVATGISVCGHRQVVRDCRVETQICVPDDDRALTLPEETAEAD